MSRWLPRRLSLRLLLIALTVVSGGLAWYGNHIRVLMAERAKLEGIWIILQPDGTPSFVGGQQQTVTFIREMS